MTNIVNREALVAALTSLCRVVDHRNTIPILRNLMVEADRRRGFFIHGTDLDLTLSVRVRDAKVLNNATFTVEAKNLLDMVKRGKSSEVMIDPVDPSTNTVQFRMNGLLLKLHMLPVDDFPKFDKIEEKHFFTISTENLLHGLTRCAPSISMGESRYYLNGVYWHIGNASSRRKEMRFVATDGHRLAKLVMPVPKGAEKMPAMILPRLLVLELIKACSAKTAPDNVLVYVIGETEDCALRVVFHVGDYRYESKLIDGTFPDYERVIPTGNDKTVTIDREAAIDAIKAVAAIKKERIGAVKLTLNGATRFTCRDHDRGEATQQIEGNLIDPAVQNASLEIGFNFNYLISIFEQMESDAVTLNLSDMASPTIITGRDDKNALHVLMPIRV